MRYTYPTQRLDVLKNAYRNDVVCLEKGEYRAVPQHAPKRANYAPDVGFPASSLKPADKIHAYAHTNDYSRAI